MIAWLRRVDPLPWIFLVILFAIPLVTRENTVITVLTVGLVWAFWASSLNLIWGYAGQFSMAQVALGGVSAYVSVVLTEAVGVPAAASIAIGMAASVIVSLVIGYVTLRLEGFRFAIMTLAFALAGVGLASTLEITGRTTGISSSTKWPEIQIGDFTWSLSSLDGGFAMFLVLMFAIMAIAMHALFRVRLGRGLLAIREDPLLSESLGTSVTRFRLLAFVLSAVVAGAAGIFQAQYFRFIYPSLFSFGTLVTVIVVLVLGGRGLIFGPLIGGLIYAILGTGFRVGGEFEGIVFGAAIILIVIFARHGVTHYIRLGYEKLLDRLSGRTKPDQVMVSSSVHVERDAARPEIGTVVLEAEGLNKHFGGVSAADDVTFSLRQGEVLGLIGPNGAGKTTLFNLVSGFARPDSGTVRFLGKDVTRLTPVGRARMGLVRTFQQPRTFADLTVLDNVVIAAEGRRVGAERLDRREAVERTLDQFGLTTTAKLPASKLSYGQRKRLGVALAIATGASVIMLDEPAAGLNTSEIEQLEDDLLRFRNDGGTILLVEHHMELVMEICDRVLVLDAGRLIAAGDPEQIASDPVVIEAYLGGVAS